MSAKGQQRKFAWALLIGSLRADHRLKRDIQAWPQQIVWIGKLHSHLGGLRCRIEVICSGDQAVFVRILVAGRQDEGKFTLLACLLQCLEYSAALKVKVNGGRCLADHIDWVELHDGSETALIAGFLGDVCPLLDECPKRIRWGIVAARAEPCPSFEQFAQPRLCGLKQPTLPPLLVFQRRDG